MSLVIAIEAEEPIAAELRALLGEHARCVPRDAAALDCLLLAHAPLTHDALELLVASGATGALPEHAVVVVTRDENLHFRRAALGAGAMECVALATLSREGLLGAIQDAIARFAPFRRSAAFRDTFESAAIGLAHVALDGRFLTANSALCKLTGYTLEELRGKTFSDITHPEDLKYDWDQAHRLLRGEISSYSMEKRYIRSGGSEVWIRLNVALAHDEHRVPFFIAVIEDIDARKAAEREHRKLLELAEHSCDFISTADLDGHLTYLNPGGRAMVGLSAESDIRGVHLADYVAERWRPFCESTLLPTLLDRGMWNGEMQFVNLQRGEPIDVSRLSLLLKDPDTGKPWCIATVARDIGDRKRAERALEEADERLRAQLSASDVGLWNWEAKQNRVHVDPNLIRLFGLDPADDTGNLDVYLARIHPEDRERVGTTILNSVQSGVSYDQVYRVLRPEGGVRWLHARGLIERAPDGSPASFLGIALDVSQRYETEARLRESESILRSLYESSVFMMGVVEIPDDDSDILHIYDSPATYRFFEAAPGSMDRKWSSELGVPSPVLARWIATYRESEREKRAVRFEYEHPGPTGTSSLVSVVTCIGRAPHGGTRFSYVTEDITERKRSEQRLRDRDIHLGLAMAASLTIAFDWDIRSNRVWRPRSIERALPETGEDWDTFEGVASVVHPDDRGLFHANIREALRSSSGKYRSEHRIVRSDGEVRWLFETGTVDFDANRNPIRLLGVSQDVSDRHQVQETLQRQAHLIDISYEPIMLWTRDRGILEWNRGAERLYGFTKAEALGKIVHELLQTRSPVRPEQIHRELERCGEWTGELRHTTRDGRELIVESRQQLVRAYGQVWVLESDRDITERKRAEAELREADRRKDQFIAMLAHELRNPLAPVRNAVEILKRSGTNGPQLSRARDVIARQVTHMTRLVDDLLDVSRVARGKLELQKQPCDLRGLVHQTADDYRATLEAAGLTLTIEEGPEPLWVEGDPVRLAQMVGNLLHNANRFTPSGGRVRVRTSQDTGARQAVVSVEDTGTGMDASFLSRLFDPFSQADQDFARSKGGLGLGLALTRGLVELHGGRVEAHSPGPGQGSTFVLRMPLSESREEAAAPSDAIPVLRPRLRILVVEDNADAAETLGELLTLQGHQVRLALDGAAGVALAREFRPDVVISDLGLPGDFDGYAVARRLRQEPSLSRTHLIALSGYASDDARRRSSEAGFQAHFAKPPDLPKLEQTLNAVASKLEPDRQANARPA